MYSTPEELPNKKGLEIRRSVTRIKTNTTEDVENGIPCKMLRHDKDLHCGLNVYGFPNKSITMIPEITHRNIEPIQIKKMLIQGPTSPDDKICTVQTELVNSNLPLTPDLVMPEKREISSNGELETLCKTTWDCQKIFKYGNRIRLPCDNGFWGDISYEQDEELKLTKLDITAGYSSVGWLTLSGTKGLKPIKPTGLVGRYGFCNGECYWANVTLDTDGTGLYQFLPTPVYDSLGGD